MIGTQYNQLENPSNRVVLHTGLAQQFVNTIPSGSVDLVITSPPYNLGKSYETKVGLSEYLQQYSDIVSQLHRIISETGSVCWQVGNFVQNGEVFPLDMFFYPLFANEGFKLRNRIIWRFGHGLHAKKRFSGRYETLLWFTKSDNYKFNLDPVRVRSKYPGKRHSKGPKKGQPSGNPKGKNPSDMWDIVVRDWESGVWDIPNVKSNHVEKSIHPCQFPVELVERCVLALTDQEDVVFDPYVGVGSSLIGALKHKRRAIGVEKSSVYADIAVDRIHQFDKNALKLRPLGRPIHQPKAVDKVAQVPEAWMVNEETIYYQAQTTD